MKITQDIIKAGSINRPQAKNSCKYITIHDTANKSRGADASAHAKYIKGLKEKTSWHYTVDDSEIYQHLPDDEKSYHTSSLKANESSIAIELCVNVDGDFEKTKQNAAKLVDMLMEKYCIPKENIRAHRDWTGKDCPASLRGDAWKAFVQLCTEQKTENQGSERIISIDELRKMGYTAIRI